MTRFDRTRHASRETFFFQKSLHYKTCGYDQSVFSFGDVFISSFIIFHICILLKNKTNNIYILYLAGIYDFGTIVA